MIRKLSIDFNPITIRTKPLKEKINEWMKKVEQQKRIIREYKEETESQQKSFNEQEEPQINFLQTQVEIKIPEEIEHPWMDYLIQEERDDINRIVTSQIINLNHIIGETAYIKEVEELLT